MEMETRTPSPDDTIFVALGKNLKEGQTILMWTLHNLRGRKICICHVHQPAQTIPICKYQKLYISLIYFV